MSRYSSYRFQTDATLEHVQPILSAVRAALLGDRKHAAAHPSFHLEGEALSKHRFWTTKVQSVEWVYADFSEDGGRRRIEALVSFTAWYTSGGKAWLCWVENADGSTQALQMQIGTRKEVIAELTDSSQAIYLQMTKQIPWTPSKSNKARYEAAVKEAEAAGNTKLVRILEDILRPINAELSRYELVTDLNEMGQSPFDTFCTMQQFGFTLVELGEEQTRWVTPDCDCYSWSSCECQAVEKTTQPKFYCTPKVENGKVCMNSRTFPVDEMLFHNVLLNGRLRNYNQGVLQIGAWSYRFTLDKETGRFTILPRRAAVQDENAEGEKLWDAIKTQEDKKFSLGVVQSVYAPCDPDYCSNPLCNEEKVLVTFEAVVEEEFEDISFAKIAQVQEVVQDNERRVQVQKQWVQKDDAFALKPIQGQFNFTEENDFALAIQAATNGALNIKRLTIIVGEWSQPVLVGEVVGQRSYLVQKRYKARRDAKLQF